MALQTSSFQKRSGFAQTPPEPRAPLSHLLVRKEPQSAPQARTEPVPRGTLAGVKLSVTKTAPEEPLMRPLAATAAPKIGLGNSFIIESEARLDKKGNPIIYKLPKEDGGGAEEIAGFTTKYNPKELSQLKSVAPEQRKDVLKGLIEKKTANAYKWGKNPVVQGILQDTIFHRGDGGASNIVRFALGTAKGKDTHPLEPKEIEALNKLDPLDAINAITEGRLKYENEVIGNRPKLAKGLQNRFNNARKYFASQYLETNI